MSRVELILAGFGNVGKAFYELVRFKRKGIMDRYGLDLFFRAVLRKRGWVSSVEELEKGIQPATRWDGVTGDECFFPPKKSGVWVECTPSDLHTGEPGRTHILRALDLGWHVVTAAKGPLVVDPGALYEKAESRKRRIRISGATAAALPAVDTALYALAGTEIRRIEGILNGTSNYILTRMHKGLGYEEALREAQKKGIAETDPSMDVDGWDTAVKLLLISNAALKQNLCLKNVRVEGICGLSREELNRQSQKGKTVKLLGTCSAEKDRMLLSVKPAALDGDHPLYGVSGAEKGITFHTDTMSRITVTGGKSDPGGAAAALLKDIINLHHYLENKIE